MNCPKCGAFLLKDGNMMKGDERYLCVGGHSFFWGTEEYGRLESQRMKIIRRAA